MTKCGKCDRDWTGLTECHCVTCHRHFGAVSAFDAHRVGADEERRCADPETLTSKTGRPKLSAVPRASGTVWVTYDPREHYFARQREIPPSATAGQASLVDP